MNRQNPYVGPRPLQEGEPLYGRSEELRELTNLLLAERILLLYSPSGAGKTSLIQAGLLPNLVRRGFRILGPIRPGEGAGLVSGSPANRYLAATAAALDRALPPSHTLDADAPLSELLAALQPIDAPAPVAGGEGQHPEPDGSGGATGGEPSGRRWAGDLLIFDQFEEVLLADPNDHDGRVAFFEQLGIALTDPTRWALFAMREEHIAALDPYRHPIPTQLETTFRLDLLGVPQAVEAIRGPAADRGVDFPEELAEGVARDLARVRRPMDKREPETAAARSKGEVGRWVEPVQLQVVCNRIWQQFTRDDPAATTITEHNLAQIGDVDAALRDYYAESVATAAVAGGLRERRLREWLGDALITPSGARDQFLWEPSPSTAQLDAALDVLVDAHLLRAERRRDIIWLELAHDRLIQPVVEDNAAWLDRTLLPFQRQAGAWDRAGRPTSLLLAGTALAAAQRWAADPGNSAELEGDPVETAFLTESRNAAERARHVRRLRLGAAAVLGVAALAVVAALFSGYLRAQAASRLELSRRLAFDAVSVREREPSLALLLAAAAYRTEDTFESRSSLVAALSPEGQPVAEFEAEREPFSASLTAVAVSPDGAQIVAGSRAGILYRWDSTTGERAILHSPPGSGIITRLAFSPDGRTLVAADDRGTLLIYQAAGAPPAAPLAISAHADLVNDLTFGPRGLLYTLGKGELAIWRVNERGAEELARRPAPEARRLALHPEGIVLVTAHEDGSAQEWPLDEAGVPSLQPASRLAGYRDTPVALAVSRPGEIAAGYEGGPLVVWPAQGARNRDFRYAGLHEGRVTGLAWDTEGEWLVSSSVDSRVIVWNRRGQVRERWRGHVGAVNALAVSTGGVHAVSAGADGRVLLWPLNVSGSGAFATRLTGHEREIKAVAFAPEGEPLIATGGADGQVRLWPIPGNGGPGELLEENLRPIRRLAFDATGSRLAAGDERGEITIWSLASASAPLTLRHGDGFVNGLAFVDDVLISAGLDGRLNAWTVPAEGGAGLLNSADAGGEIVALAVQPGGRLWVLDRQGTVVAWLWSGVSRTFERLDTVLTPLSNAQVSAASLAVAQEGALLALGGLGRIDGQVILAPAGVENRPLAGHTDTVSALAFNPAADLLASGGHDGQLRLWDVATQRQLGVPLRSAGPQSTTSHLARMVAGLP
jgi:WD40 repeat protein